MASSPADVPVLVELVRQAVRSPLCDEAGLASDALADIGANLTAPELRHFAWRTRRNEHEIGAPGIPEDAAKEFAEIESAEWLTIYSWPSWVLCNGSRRYERHYRRTGEHIAALMARWLMGQSVPFDIDVACRRYGMRSDYSRAQVKSLSDHDVERLFWAANGPGVEPGPLK